MHERCVECMSVRSEQFVETNIVNGMNVACDDVLSENCVHAWNSQVVRTIINSTSILKTGFSRHLLSHEYRSTLIIISKSLYKTLDMILHNAMFCLTWRWWLYRLRWRWRWWCCSQSSGKGNFQKISAEVLIISIYTIHLYFMTDIHLVFVVILR